ncbi:olfactory receptor 4A47-like [Dama dama]|uniref:olfactory receptor 4A47-like n=1 Tax=Dama dama TaxID=30532 RepID=UPI002A36BCAD|nr:olfactory receptor 4A47-like [Dama dama]
MAYDRYVAICKPLHYLVIMRQRTCIVPLAVSWVGGFLHSVIKLSTVYGLPFCGPSVIDHHMCDMYPLLKLVSTDTYTESRNNVTYFVLLGLTQNPKEGKVLLFMFLFVYILTVVGNFLIIVTITVSKTLNSPMYFFLACLSFMDIAYSSSITPRLISDLFFGEKTITFKSCMTQLFTEHLFSGAGVFLLLVMAYDRYVAICKPLHYLVIMRQRVCVLLLVVSWAGGFLHSVIQLSTIYGLPFCGPNVIDHFLCDMYPLLELVCADTYIIGVLVVVNGGLICTIVFLLLLVSYGVILHSLKNLSQEGRRKALQTCGSHITVVVCFFVPCIFIYVRPAKTFYTDKSLSVFYTVITPMLNPLIYSLRNSELTYAMKKLWKRSLISHIK